MISSGHNFTCFCDICKIMTWLDHNNHHEFSQDFNYEIIDCLWKVFQFDTNSDGQLSPPRTSNSKCIRQRVQSMIFPGYLQSRLMKFWWNTNQVLLNKSVVSFWQIYKTQKIPAYLFMTKHHYIRHTLPIYRTPSDQYWSDNDLTFPHGNTA